MPLSWAASTLVLRGSSNRAYDAIRDIARHHRGHHLDLDRGQLTCR